MARVKKGIAFLLLGVLLAACGNEPAPTMQKNSQPAAPTTAAPKPPDEDAALDGIKKVIDGQATYFKVNRRYALTFDELLEARMLAAEPTAAQTGYEFKLRPAADTQTYKLFVSPAAASATARSFFTDNKGVIHAETGKDATAESPALAK